MKENVGAEPAAVPAVEPPRLNEGVDAATTDADEVPKAGAEGEAVAPDDDKPNAGAEHAAGAAPNAGAEDAAGAAPKADVEVPKAGVPVADPKAGVDAAAAGCDAAPPNPKLPEVLPKAGAADDPKPPAPVADESEIFAEKRFTSMGIARKRP